MRRGICAGAALCARRRPGRGARREPGARGGAGRCRGLCRGARDAGRPDRPGERALGLRFLQHDRRTRASAQSRDRRRCANRPEIDTMMRSASITRWRRDEARCASRPARRCSPRRPAGVRGGERGRASTRRRAGDRQVLPSFHRCDGRDGADRRSARVSSGGGLRTGRRSSADLSQRPAAAPIAVRQLRAAGARPARRSASRRLWPRAPAPRRRSARPSQTSPRATPSRAAL